MAETSEPVHVLLVEDNPGDARLVKEYLSESQTIVPKLTWVKSIADAIEAMNEKAFDVVLLDLSLPDGRGIDVARQIRTADEDVPIVVLSGEEDEQLAMLMVREGAQDYLVKGRVDGFVLVRSLQYARQRIEQSRQLRRAALHDSLTDLANRASMSETLRRTLAQARRYQHTVGLLFVDLDGFKAVNDTYGHGAGDEVLRAVAGRLSAALRESDFVARLGGDEFAVLLPNVEAPDEAERVAKKLVAVLRERVKLESGEITQVSASVGISLFPENASDSDELLRTADAAMYEAKRLGKNRVAFFANGKA